MILPILLLSIWTPTTQCVPIDGDTLKCTEIGRVRLLGIDAPELPGHCRKGRACAPGDPVKSKAHLAKLIRGGVTIAPITRDRYGRTVAQVYAGSKNVACEQLRAGMAIYAALCSKRTKAVTHARARDGERIADGGNAYPVRVPGGR